jgi:hypothetical protein
MPKITLTGSYQTRDKRKVLRIVATDLPGEYPVGAVFQASDGEDAFGLFTDEGHCFSKSWPSANDLIPIPKPFSFERWVNVYPDTGSASAELCDHKTKEAADACSLKSRIACVRVTISGVEGEGL